MDAIPNLTSIGSAAGQLQTPVSRIDSATDDLGIHPALILNGIRYFGATEIERIAEHIREDSRPESRVQH